MSSNAQPPHVLFLRAVSGREWHLRLTHQVSPNIRLCADEARPNSAPLVLKSIHAPTDDAYHLAVNEIEEWRRGHSAEPDLVLAVIDVVEDDNYVHVISPYCPGGDLSKPQPERIALRHIAAVSAAVDVVITSSGQPAYGNITPSHVLLDHAGMPRLSGWGLTRARRLKSTRKILTEYDDVRALAATLYNMIYGHRFSPSFEDLPSTPPLTPPTHALLDDILISRKIPSLTVFRYDIAAARRLVPVCGPALAPLRDPRKEELLSLDLNSSRGSVPPPSPAIDSLTTPPPSRLSPPRQSRISTPLQPIPEAPGQRPPSESDSPLSSDVDIEATVKAVTQGDLARPDDSVIESLVEASTTIDQIPDRVFNVLFHLPISKNPLVAFKVVRLLHQLLSEGPAQVTALTLAQDGFMAWIQSSWTRERLQTKTGKVHMYAYCFSADDIAYYTVILRRRVEVHAKFAQLLTTHWIVRPAGIVVLDTRRREAFRLILDVVEKCGAVIRKILASRDPAAPVKHSAAAPLHHELIKAFLVLSWIFAVANEHQRAELLPELEVAHTAARIAIQCVSEQPEVQTLCHPSSLLDMPERAPYSLDQTHLITLLRKLRKKKKKKTQESAFPKRQNAMPNEQHDNLPYSEAVTAAASDITDRRYSGVPHENGVSGLRPATPTENVNVEETPATARKEVSVSNRLQKLSVSVRKGNGSRVSDANDLEERGDSHYQRRRNESNGKPPRPYKDENGKDNSRRLRLDDAYGSSSDGSEAEGSSRDLQGARRNVRGKPQEARESSTRKHSSNRLAESDDDDSESEERAPRSRDSPGRALPHGRRASDGTDTRTRSQGKKSNETSARKLQKPKSATRRSLSQDIPSPQRKKQSERRNRVDNSTDESEGSREALAAAAQGWKTPNINPLFEVAPYEVKFGSQIGSGGFGVVYKANFRSEVVAVKKIHAHALSNAASVGEFQSEVAVLCTLKHANIIRFVGACTKPPNLMIITEYMANGTLFDLLHQSQARVTWPMRKKFALDTCKGMTYLHNSKLLHRDLKSSNLLLDEQFNCKVGDFGLTRISRGSAAVQMTGQCGTFQYMAVEVLANKPYSEKADVFSFGILLWEMVSRKLPYFGMQPMQVGIAVLQQGLRPTIPPKCPLPLSKLMRACWDDDPSKRPTFGQLVDTLEAMPE